MKTFLAVQEAVRSWIVPGALVLGILFGWRVYASHRAQRHVAEVAGAAEVRIQEVDAAAARGDDAELQRLDAEALARAEELINACGARCR